jgi:hypothetical protein
MNATPQTVSPCENPDAEVCAICGRAVESVAFCHIYREGRRITLCTPSCAEIFLHPDDGATPASLSAANYDRPFH